MESLIDNCWQFRSRQLLDTDYEILMSSLFTRTIGTIRGNVFFKLNGIPLDFHLSKKKILFQFVHIVVHDIFFKFGKISRNIAFQLSGAR